LKLGSEASWQYRKGSIPLHKQPNILIDHVRSQPLYIYSTVHTCVHKCSRLDSQLFATRVNHLQATLVCSAGAMCRCIDKTQRSLFTSTWQACQMPPHPPPAPQNRRHSVLKISVLKISGFQFVSTEKDLSRVAWTHDCSVRLRPLRIHSSRSFPPDFVVYDYAPGGSLSDEEWSCEK
jgi:hypothetical protein